MSVYFIADLHLGHKNILKFEPEKRYGSTIEEHNQWLVTQWNSVVNKQDFVYVLGDVAFGTENLKYLQQMNGTKYLVRGNHDQSPISEYLYYFEDVFGLMKYKEFWLTHAPIHPCSLRGKVNIHGHLHSRTVNDPNYFCVSVEHLNGIPISLEKIREAIAKSRS